MCHYLQNPSAKNDEVNLIASTNTTNDDITTDDDSGIEEIEEWIDIKNIPRLEGSNYDSQGNSVGSSYSSSLSDVNNNQIFSIVVFTLNFQCMLERGEGRNPPVGTCYCFLLVEAAA